MFDLAQRVALLTGANGGIGRAITRQFTELGAWIQTSSATVDLKDDFQDGVTAADAGDYATALEKYRLAADGVCQRSCPPISCGVSDF